MSDLQQLAVDAVERAMKSGATDAECTISEGSEFSAGVRMRELETITDAGSRGAGIRVLIGQRAGSAYTSDLSSEGIATMVRSALELARITSEDPHAGLPAAEDLGMFRGDLALHDEAIAKMEAEWKIAQAKLAEEAALNFDPRIENSKGGSFDSYLGAHYFANSRGFAGSYRTSSCALSVSPVAKQNGSMERDYWHTAARCAAQTPPGLSGSALSADSSGAEPAPPRAVLRPQRIRA